jgi:hypothetical protein
MSRGFHIFILHFLWIGDVSAFITNFYNNTGTKLRLPLIFPALVISCYSAPPPNGVGRAEALDMRQALIQKEISTLKAKFCSGKKK